MTSTDELKHLTPKQQRFVTEFCICFNAAEAARRSGYSAKTAGQMGFENLKKPEVQKAIRERVTGYGKDAGVNTKRILAELAAIAFGNITDLIEWDMNGARLIPSGQLSALSAKSVKSLDLRIQGSSTDNGRPERISTLKVTMHDKIRALELLGKALGLFTGSEREELRNPPTAEELLERIRPLIPTARGMKRQHAAD